MTEISCFFCCAYSCCFDFLFSWRLQNSEEIKHSALLVLSGLTSPFVSVEWTHLNDALSNMTIIVVHGCFLPCLCCLTSDVFVCSSFESLYLAVMAVSITCWHSPEEVQLMLLGLLQCSLLVLGWLPSDNVTGGARNSARNLAGVAHQLLAVCFECPCHCGSAGKTL